MNKTSAILPGGGRAAEASRRAYLLQEAEIRLHRERVEKEARESEDE